MDKAMFTDGNYKVEDQKIEFEDQTYSYTDIKCLYHDIQYAHFLILDLIQETNLQKFFVNNITYDRYKRFEKSFLEDIFFSSLGDNRFNIYLIFLAPSKKKINAKYEIQKDFQYARKLFLYENEIGNFFRDSISLKRYKSDNSFTASYDKQKILQELYQSREIATNLCTLELKIGLMLENTKPKYIKLQDEMFLYLSIVRNHFSNENKKEIYYKENITRNKRVVKQERPKLASVAMIKNLVIKNFRCFKECDIPFKKVNLLYGENGVGKTSILEAIELGVTGYNRNNSNNQEAISRVYCMDEKNKDYLLSNENQNIELSDYWYNVKSQNCREFNELFHRFNYFDTNWVSEFAIAGKEQVNIMQLQKYLGIEKIENGKLALIKLYETLKELAEFNLKTCNKKNKFALRFWDVHGRFIYRRNLEQLLKKTNAAIITCDEQLKRLKDEKNAISIDAILDKHINKIESIFKLLVAANEFTDLDFYNGEIRAIVNSSENEVQMSQMSTGQKICLALSLMFALFLSLDKAPNIVMLDEPVANLDDMHMLNLLDVLRRMAIAGTQIFFTTANPDVAKLFRRKFSFLGNDFACYRINEVNDNVHITCEEYSLCKEEIESQKKIL